MSYEDCTDLYDIEFLGLVTEINKYLDKITKGDKLKVMSWLKVLSVPTKTIEFKKKRNLHGIVLLDNLLNNKLDSPFNKFAYSQNDLAYLPPEKVKAELSKKFKKLISSESIELQGRNQKIKNDKDNMVISDGERYYYEEKYFKGVNDINQVNLKDPAKQFEIDKFKLESIIMTMQDRIAERDAIIAQQQKEINNIKNKIYQLEKKRNIILEHHKRMNNIKKK